MNAKFKLIVLCSLFINSIAICQSDYVGKYEFESDTINTITEYVKISYQLNLNGTYNEQFIGCGNPLSNICNITGKWKLKKGKIKLIDDRDNLEYGKVKILLIEKNNLRWEKGNQLFIKK